MNKKSKFILVMWSFLQFFVIVTTFQNPVPKVIGLILGLALITLSIRNFIIAIKLENEIDDL